MLLFAALILAAPTSLHVAQDVEPLAFQAGDLSRLETRIASSKPIANHMLPGTLVWVEVDNKTPYYVEPTLFRWIPKDATGTRLDLERYPTPYVGRAGRMVGPKKRESFPLLLPLKHDATRGGSFEILAASFVAQPRSKKKPPIELGRPKIHKGTRNGYPSRDTRIQITSFHDLAVDCTFEVKIVGLRKGTGLWTVRLEPGETKVHVIEQVSITSVVGGGGLEGDGPDHWPNAEFKTIKLVDWSIVEADPAQVAGSLVASAWASHVHAPESAFPLEADVHVSMGKLDDVPCRLVFAADGSATVLPGTDVTTALAEEIGQLLRLVPWTFAPLALDVKGADLIAAPDLNRVRLEAKLHATAPGRSVDLASGRIVCLGEGDSRETWATKDAPKGRWVLADLERVDGETSTNAHFTWDLFGNLRLIEEAQISHSSGGNLRSLTVTFDDWRPHED